MQFRRRERRVRADPQVDYSPAGVAHIETTEKQFVQRCVDKMGLDFLANIGTASVVKDLETLRAALGDEKLTYLGYSYGTLIGSAYAEAYPDKVRAMILDGAVDPNAAADPRPMSTRLPASRRPSTITPPTVARDPTVRWARTRPRRSTSTATWWTRWWANPPPPRIREG